MLSISFKLALLLAFTDGVHQARYECGDHGRFEYCIDNIPGCVIGCYCHPGYYFDTEAKICEPNSKITLNYRRNEYSDHSTLTTQELVTETQLSTSTSTYLNKTAILDSKVDEITNNVDDLSDWLYKQFFKAVENQVVNNTDEIKANRRSGRKLKKHIGGGHRKRRSKKRKSLKRKMLRISEDDSLFDSESSESDSGSDSEITDDSDDSASSERSTHDKDHGHRSIMLIHKKPKVPLPSFVFLPDGGTPFYPPVQLPAPPTPMFPMVPVPPMFAPPVIIVHPESTSKSEATSVTETSKPDDNSVVTDPDKPTTIALTTSESETQPTSEVEPPTTESERLLRKRKKMKQKLPRDNKDKYTVDNYLRNTPQLMSPQHDPETYNFSNNDEIPDVLSDPLLFDAYRRSMIRPTERYMEAVNFKYLTQLIHKMKRNDKPQISSDFNNIENLPKLNKKNPNSNRKTVINVIEPSERKNSGEVFYSKLGKEIASLVRRIESSNSRPREVDIEIQSIGDNPQRSYQPIINENNYGSRSYWDRIARSPSNANLKNFAQNSPTLYANSNEELNELENIVEFAVTVAPTFSLTELESIINMMDKNEFNKDNIKLKRLLQSETASQRNSLNINFLHNNPSLLKLYSEKLSPNYQYNSNKPLYTNYNKRNLNNNNQYQKMNRPFISTKSKSQGTNTVINKGFQNIQNQNKLKYTSRLHLTKPETNSPARLYENIYHDYNALSKKNSNFNSSMLFNYRAMKYFTDDDNAVESNREMRILPGNTDVESQHIRPLDFKSGFHTFFN